MALTIGSRTFQDRVTISYITRHPGMANLAEVIAGEFSSPEANLYSPLINGKFASGLDFRTFNAVNMSFEIRVTEHGKKFSVFFSGRSESGTACSIVGTAFANVEKTKVFGTFVMTKDTADCDCGAK